MDLLFYLSALIAVISTLLVITRTNAVHALLYLIVSLLAVAMIFFLLGAPFVAALEVIIYAGAIMVLFIFVIMMLNLGGAHAQEEAQLLTPGIWRGPAILSMFLAAELIYLFTMERARSVRNYGSNAQAGRHGIIWPVCAGRGAGFHAAPGRSGRRVPSRQAA